MEASDALSDLTEISSQIEAAVLFDTNGEVAASTLDDGRSRRLVEGARALLDAAEGIRSAGKAVAQLEVGTPEGSVFVVRDGERLALATTGPEPTVGLVFYDLKTCLRNSRPERAKTATRRGSATKAGTDDASA